ncbi:hypothetical protein SD70_14080 [Gordoniibacillus kamchatkensis]|uniref:D-alanyl-D-alanine dipeptidase n=1 Tax=Gordoniibacillus kamchatkensis TaxID=1590651 RepID=A0ABR5AH67_9BACL|nr:hypothetical protein SD70_14080 [Paenibacillus sp. VKM B-2647]
MVPLSNLSPRIKVFPYYYHHNVTGAMNECYLRAGAAQRLVQAAGKLPKGLHFLVLDGWRPYEVQKALYDMTKEAFEKKGMSEDEVRREISKFVAYPSDDADAPSPHMTGGAVDLTIAGADGWLDMGTGFDEFTEKARTDWYETAKALSEAERAVRDNRRLLKQAMTEAGFRSYDEEWWHFDYGNIPWGKATNQVAIYKGVKQVSIY